MTEVTIVVERIYGKRDISNAITVAKSRKSTIAIMIDGYRDALLGDAYARRAKVSPNELDALWLELNTAIIERWSVSALVRVKRGAWRQLKAAQK